jgi:hypothetical protein
MRRAGVCTCRHTFCFTCLANTHAPASCEEHTDWRDRLDQVREARRKLNEEIGGGLTVKEEFNKGVRTSFKVVAVFFLHCKLPLHWHRRASGVRRLVCVCAVLYRPPTVSSVAPTQAAV